jgi:hypothetical protein
MTDDAGDERTSAGSRAEPRRAVRVGQDEPGVYMYDGIRMVRPSPPTHWRGWRPWAWALLVVMTVVETAVVLLFSFLIAFSAAAACNGIADPGDVVTAQRQLAVLASLTFAPWVLACVWVRRRLRLLVAGVICASPAWLGFMDGWLRPNSYSLGWCFG